MPTPDEDVVKRILATNNRDVACRRAVEDAWVSVNNQYSDKVWWRRKSTRAALMWEHSVNNVIAALEGDAGTKIIRHHDTTSFVFDDVVLLRFKKASIELHSSNYPTLLATLFHVHERDLFGHEGHHRVEIAHVLNRFETALDWVGVVARERKRVLWHFELGSGGAAVESLPFPKPVEPAADRVLHPTKPLEEEAHEQEDK